MPKLTKLPYWTKSGLYGLLFMNMIYMFYLVPFGNTTCSGMLTYMDGVLFMLAFLFGNLFLAFPLTLLQTPESYLFSISGRGFLGHLGHLHLLGYLYLTVIYFFIGMIIGFLINKLHKQNGNEKRNKTGNN